MCGKIDAEEPGNEFPVQIDSAGSILENRVHNDIGLDLLEKPSNHWDGEET